jgi:UDP-4-amino-4,6-dideoxy-N-acetyl-beta-L-altrosamine N-acetyltransferase
VIPLKIKKADINDCEVLFSWVNDIAIRSNAFNSTEINFKEHKYWFNNKLLSPNSIIYIGYEGKTPIGQVRFDKENINYVSVDIHIDPAQRKRGLGKELLTLSIAECYNSKIFSSDVRIQAIIFESNTASLKMFERSHFVHSKNEIISDIPCTTLVYNTKILPV